MSAPVAIRSNYPDLFGTAMLPVLEEMFTYEAEQYPMAREQVFKVVSTDRDIWQSSELLDLDMFMRIPEGTEYTFKRPVAGVSRTYSPDKFGLGFSVSEEMVEDGKFDLVGMMVRKLARSGRESQEASAMNIFNNGFSTELSADGQPVFSASHTLGGVTGRNIPLVASDLSESSLQTALADFERIFVGNTGIINRIRPRILLVSPENKRYAMELVGSELKPDTADNNLNSIRMADDLIVVSSPHLTDPDAWFLLASPEDTGLRIVQRKPLETVASSRDVGFVTDSIFYKARYREAIGVASWFGIYGSAGA